jgi:virginiamycin B lyase
MGHTSYAARTVVAGLVLALAAAGCSGDDDGAAAPAPSAAPPPATTTATTGAVASAAPDLPAVVDVTELDAQVLPGGNGDWAMAVRGDVWVAGLGPGLVAFDGATGHRVAAVAAGPVYLGMEQAEGDLFLCTDVGELVRVDGARRTARYRARLGVHPLEEASVAVGGGEVFIPTGVPTPGIVVADAATGERLRRIPAPAYSSGLRYGFGSLWTAVAPDQLVRLDPRTGDVQDGFTVGGTPVFLSVGASAVWVMNQADGSASSVDPRTGEVTTVTVDTGPIQGGDIVAGRQAVWVRVTDALVARVDVRTKAVTLRIGPASGSGSVALSGRNVWITAHDVHHIWRVPQQ